MLALYPDKQEKLYEHIMNVLPVDRSPVCFHVIYFTYTG